MAGHEKTICGRLLQIRRIEIFRPVISEPFIMESANFKARAMALAIDSALLAAIQSILFLLLAGRLVDQLMHLELAAILFLFSWYAAVIFLSVIFLPMVYFTLFHAWFGQTIGKMIMGLKVVMQDNGKISPAVSFLRWTGYILSLVPLAAGFLWSAVDKDHCAWHDRLAHTRVVSVEMT